MNLQLDLTTLLNLLGVISGSVAIVVGLRAKLEMIRVTIQLELEQLNKTITNVVAQLASHEKDIQDLKWRTRKNGDAHV
jgi:hypothetical protein